MVIAEELVKQIWEVEGVKVKLPVNYRKGYMFESYPYTEPFPGSMTVNEFLNERVRPILHTAKEISSI